MRTFPPAQAGHDEVPPQHRPFSAFMLA
jgi:hypothetical protein